VKNDTEEKNSKAARRRGGEESGGALMMKSIDEKLKLFSEEAQSPHQS